MPFQIIRNDITQMDVDAIINSANPNVAIGDGVESRIYEGSGPELFKAREKIGLISVGEAKFTKGYNLKARYIIHTVGPIWIDGHQDELKYLKKCYFSSLALASQMNLESIAFPLISSGTYGYPKDQALSVAIDTIKTFLNESDMMVYLVVYDETSYQLSKTLVDDVKHWILENARPLEIALFNHLFESGPIDKVTSALETYQNNDGGFGHGLEPDFWTPLSNPIDTWTAINIMRLIQLENSHPMISKTIKYLKETPYQYSGRYYFRIPDINNHPHAPWWHYQKGNEIEGYNPTASLIGFILKHTSPKDDFYAKTHQNYLKMVADVQTKSVEEMHELRCFIEMYHDLKDVFNLTDFYNWLETQVVNAVDTNSASWHETYTTTPSQVILYKDSPGYNALRHLVYDELKLFMHHKNHAGVWDITWSWADDRGMFARAKREWQGIIALSRLIRLTHFECAID